MEKRFYLGLIILAVILATSIGVTLGMRAMHEPVQQLLTQAADTAQEDWEQALSLAQKAYDRWQNYHSMTASFADHSPMDDTDTLFQEMLVYGQTKEVPHFIACCRELTVMTQAMYDAHTFSLKNLL